MGTMRTCRPTSCRCEALWEMILKFVSVLQAAAQAHAKGMEHQCLCCLKKVALLPRHMQRGQSISPRCTRMLLPQEFCDAGNLADYAIIHGDRQQGQLPTGHAMVRSRGRTHSCGR